MLFPLACSHCCAPAVSALCLCLCNRGPSSPLRNLLTDLAYVSQADVLLGLHDDTLFWGFFMAKHSSVVEIRPHGVTGPAADKHMKVGVSVLLRCQRGRAVARCVAQTKLKT